MDFVYFVVVIVCMPLLLDGVLKAYTYVPRVCRVGPGLSGHRLGKVSVTPKIGRVEYLRLWLELAGVFSIIPLLYARLNQPTHS